MFVGPPRQKLLRALCFVCAFGLVAIIISGVSLAYLPELAFRGRQRDRPGFNDDQGELFRIDASLKDSGEFMRDSASTQQVVAAIGTASTAVQEFSTKSPPGTTGEVIQHGALQGAMLGDEPPSVNVCFTWGDTGKHPMWQPLVVAINSTLANTLERSRIIFHIVTTVVSAPGMRQMAARLFPGAQIKVHANGILEESIASKVAYHGNSGARVALASPFNFAPFYLDRFLEASASHETPPGVLPRRLIYLDTDVVVVGDIVELYNVDLEDKAVGAVRDCTQTFDTYVDFHALKVAGLVRSGASPKTCVFNRGVFVVDVILWRKSKITIEIEKYMAAYASSKMLLYRFGMSQPPWLLAVRDQYMPLDVKWNCRGLGRRYITSAELGTFDERIRKSLVRDGSKWWKPYVSSCSGFAKILHFNGELKPWYHHKWVGSADTPRCVESGMPSSEVPFIPGCYELWKRYISPTATETLMALHTLQRMTSSTEQVLRSVASTSRPASHYETQGSIRSLSTSRAPSVAEDGGGIRSQLSVDTTSSQSYSRGPSAGLRRRRRKKS